MKPSLKLSVFCAVSLFLSIQIVAQESYNLKYKFEKGKIYYMNTVSNGEMTQTLHPTQATAKYEEKSKIKMEISASSQDKFNVIATIESRYSRSTDQRGGADRILEGGALIGKKAEINFTNKGTTTEKKEIKDTSQTALNIIGWIPIIIRLPDKPIIIGDAWIYTDSTKTNIKDNDDESRTIINMNCKLEGKEKVEGKDCLKFSFIKNSESKSSANLGSISVLLQGKETTTGTFYFDLNTGIVIIYDAVSDSKLNSVIPEKSINNEFFSKTKTNITLTDK